MLSNRSAVRRAATGALLCMLTYAAPPAPAQDAASEMPDPAVLEAQVEELFQAALEAPEDGEASHFMMRWSAVLTSAVVAANVRLQAEGEGAPRVDAAAVAERVLARWQELRPDSPGPHLMRALQNQEPAARRDAVLAVHDRFPNHPLVVGQAVSVLMQAGEAEQAGRLAEALLIDTPEDPGAYRLRLQTVRDHETKRAEVLQRWAAATPGDPGLIGAWLSSPLPAQEPEATRRVLAGFFDRRPAGEEDLGACLQALRRAGDEFAAPARACVARTAAIPDLSPSVAETATRALAEMAAADGDWAAMTAALEEIEPESRVRALASAAARLETPGRCDEVIGLLTTAASGLAGDGPYASIARGLGGCLERPAAQALALDLLRRAAGPRLEALLGGLGVVRVNGVYRGELPAGAVALLETRLRETPDDPALFAALDVAYQLDDPHDRRFELLRRWRERAPSSFRYRQAIDLARQLVWRGEPEAAVELLEGRLETSFEREVAEALWELLLETAGAEPAARLAAELAAGDDRWRSSVGHTLAARSALLAGDVDAARDRYWRALAGERPSPEVAAELLLAGGRDAGELRAAAERICEETALGEYYQGTSGCRDELLQRAERAGAVVDLLPGPGEELPDDPQALSDLARRARAAGRVELAERAYRRVVEVDPRGDGGWLALGDLLAEQGRLDDLEALLARARGQFPSPPGSLLRTTARAATAAGRGERAVELLREARAALPEGSAGDYSRGWIDHELRQAYRLLGQDEAQAAAGLAAAVARVGPSLAVELPADATAEEIRAAAALLRSGAGGRFDPEAAAGLYARAAAMGDPLATFRIGLSKHFGRGAEEAGGATAEELYRRSADAVRSLAEDGDPFARYLLGSALASGYGGAVDPAAGRRLLRAAAEQGESWAWHNLGWAAQTGSWGEPRDLAVAIGAYRRASRLGNAESMVNLAGQTLTDYASGEVCEEGLGWLRRAADTGYAAAAAFLGKLLLYGRGDCVAARPAEALPWLEAGAEAHRPGAAYDLALGLLVAGDGEGDAARGLELMRRQVEEPVSRAAEVLTLLHATGFGVARDAERAAAYLDQAARLGSDGFAGLREDRGSPAVAELLERCRVRLEALAAEGDASAAALLARGLAVGLFGYQPGRALELARRGAAGGEALAMRVLYHAYREGTGVERDPAEALRWRSRCAHSGDSFCMMFLGQDLLAGTTQSRDVAAGVSWLRRAAETGNWWAVGALARLYDQGAPGLPADRDEAAVWMRLRAELGDPDAAGWLRVNGY